MSVSHLASSESHTGTTGNTGGGSFTWSHTPGGTARGVTVFVWTNGNLGTLATGVTYEGVTVPAVVGGEATRTASETGNIKAYHLGSGIPTASPAAVIVTRTSTNTMWACCVTQAAGTDTEIVGVETAISGSLGMAENNIDDGSPGSDSLRYAAAHLGHDTLPPAGANSTTVAAMQIDIGSQGSEVVVETVPGQGNRPVGMATVTVDDYAAVYFAVREMAGVIHLASSESHSNNIGSLSQGSFTWNHLPGGIPRGVLIFVWVNMELSLAESVTYAGVAVPALAGGEVHRVSGEAATMQSFFLGANIPATDPAAVLVTRQNTGDRLWACCMTVAARSNTEVHAPGIQQQANVATLAELNINDGSPGTNSQRYAGGAFAYDTAPTAGANTTLLHDFDPGPLTGSVVRETAPGQGARPVGWVDARSEEKAVVYLALREILPVLLPDVLSVVVYGSSYPISPIEPGPISIARMLSPDAIHVTDGPPQVTRVSATTVSFQASPDHATVTTYDAVLYTYPGHVVENTISLGKPTPDASNTITADLATLYAGQPAGDYTVVIITNTAAGGPAPSEDSNVFTLPLV